MKLYIDSKSEKPIYEQIFNVIRAAILAGELASGEVLPSMRVLAKELRISIITTKRAYEELERAGYIETYTGRGSFVAQLDREAVSDSHNAIITAKVHELMDSAASYGMTADDIKVIIDKALQKQEETIDE